MNILPLKKTFLCECKSSVPAAHDTLSIEFGWPGPAPSAGQFFLVKPERTGVFLARPLSAAGWNAGSLRFLAVRRGRGSRDIADLRPGEKAELIGPLGNCWIKAANLPDYPSYGVPYIREEAGEKPVALIAGGVGIAPLLALIPELGERPFDLYAGFRTGSFGLENIKPGKLVVSTEDGSLGRKGRITDFFTPDVYEAVFACGPEPMLRVIRDICMAADIPCFLSMERHMACGVGACLGCTVRTISGNRSCCSDGPIFNAQEICFDE